jgi:hypothetical protein
MEINIPNWFKAASGFTLKDEFEKCRNLEVNDATVNVHSQSWNHEKTRPFVVIAHLMGSDGVTERTGESMRPLRIWLAKGPNLMMVKR